MTELKCYFCCSMKRRKLIPDPVLMVISIVFLTAFQVYWLKQNYEREKKSLGIKTEVAFRETVMQLQVSKLKLDGAFKDTSNGKVKIIVKNDDDRGQQINVRFTPKRELISTVNVLRDQLLDSLKIKGAIKSNTIISLNQTSVSDNETNTVRMERRMRPGDKTNHVFNFLYGVDSLQEPLRLTEIDSSYTKSLKEQNLNIPFSIIKMDSAAADEERNFTQVTVGFSHPVTYKLQLGNTVPYLMRQIAPPILFSILLLSIIISTFVLLYRNLLKQRRLAELKNEFISNITHELKTPIATVGVAIEALKNFNAIDNPERTKEYLDISQNELQRLGLLVDKVLKLSMFEKKETEIKFETFNLQTVVDEVVSSLKLQLEKYRTRVSVTQEGDTSIQGDRLHLLSVVFNLIDNAVKYSKGEPSIHIDLKEKENKVILSITDNGIGIAPEYKEKIFEKFFRVPHGDTHDAKGYGLGLSYVAQIVEKHQGTIAIESQKDIGSTFTITLPKTQA